MTKMFCAILQEYEGMAPNHSFKSVHSVCVLVVLAGYEQSVFSPKDSLPWDSRGEGYAGALEKMACRVEIGRARFLIHS